MGFSKCIFIFVFIVLWINCKLSWGSWWATKCGIPNNNIIILLLSQSCYELTTFPGCSLLNTLCLSMKLWNPHIRNKTHDCGVKNQNDKKPPPPKTACPLLSSFHTFKFYPQICWLLESDACFLPPFPPFCLSLGSIWGLYYWVWNLMWCDRCIVEFWA